MAGKLGALVEGHDDVGTETDLGGQRGFRREEVQRAIDVRAELHAILGEFAQIAEAEDLEAAGVGEDGLMPCHELLHSAKLADGFDARAEIEMVGVVEQNLNVEFFEHVLRYAFDRGDGTDRHEDGSPDLSVRSEEAASPRRAASGFNLKGKGHGELIVRQRRRTSSICERPPKRAAQKRSRTGSRSSAGSRVSKCFIGSWPAHRRRPDFKRKNKNPRCGAN